MVLRLGEALQVPLRERNHLLHAAGLPAAYPEAGMHSADLAPDRGALETLLNAHLPYPAMVLDGRWNAPPRSPWTSCVSSSPIRWMRPAGSSSGKVAGRCRDPGHPLRRSSDERRHR